MSSEPLSTRPGDAKPGASRHAPPASAEPAVPVVRVAVAPNESIAQVWRSVLDSEEIPCYLKCVGPGPANFAAALCPHALFVYASDLKRARRLLGLR